MHRTLFVATILTLGACTASGSSKQDAATVDASTTFDASSDMDASGDGDPSEPTSDAGHDSGPLPAPDSGPPDAGRPPGIMCDDTFCERSKALLAQCCAGVGADVCGVDLRPPGSDTLGCLPQDAPGVASADCGPVLDLLEADNNIPGKFELIAGTVTIAMPTCCTAEGVCGADMNGSSAGRLGPGCIDPRLLQPAAEADAGVAAWPTEKNGLPMMPNTFCDPATGRSTCIPVRPQGLDGPVVPPYYLAACPAQIDKGCIVGVKQNVHGCGLDASDDWDRKDVADLCVNRVATEVSGCDPV